MGMGYVVMAAMLITGILGFYIGWLIGTDRTERAEAELAAQFAAIPAPGRHRTAEPRQLPAAPKAVSPSTERMFADLQAEVAAPTIPVQQLPLGQLVRPELHHRPGRATDFIEALEADTDRFIAAMGGRELPAAAGRTAHATDTSRRDANARSAWDGAAPTVSGSANAGRRAKQPGRMPAARHDRGQPAAGRHRERRQATAGHRHQAMHQVRVHRLGFP